MGYKLPLWGTGNLGNYGDSIMNLTNVHLPTSLAGGGVQIYNHSKNPFPLNFNETYSPAVDGAGNLLIESYGQLNLNENFRSTSSAGGNITMNGGTVNIQSSNSSPSHSYSGSGAGNYGIFAFANSTAGWSPLYTPNPLLCGKEATYYTWTNPENQTDRNYTYGNDIENWGFGGLGNIVVQTGQTVNVSHTGAGSLRWEATNNIETAANANITFTHSGAGKINWQAKNEILAGGNITFIRSGTGNAFWQAEDGNIVTLPSTSTKVSFNIDGSGDTVAWQAGKSIRTENEIEFTIPNTSTTSTVAWQAGDSIRTNYKTTFSNSANANILWYAKNHIYTSGGESGGTSSGDGVTFTQEEASGKTLWWAEKGNIQTTNAIFFDYSTAKSLAWWAGDSLVLGLANASAPTDNPVWINYGSNDTIEWHANAGAIQTNSQVDIIRSNTGAGRTFIHAGCATFNTNNNIDFENVYNYTASGGSGDSVILYAENDILSNQVCDNNRPAPVTFMAADNNTKTSTRWEAERNINTKGRVDFLYGNAAEMGSLTWLSRGGYIQTERPVNIYYGSDSLISLRAENMFKDQPNPQAVPNITERRGNIHTFDSVNIVRSNTGTSGLTEILAENHIWTAMVNYEDLRSSGDSLNIISHYGDIYLGHNDGTVANGTLYPPYVPGVLMQTNPSGTCQFPTASPISYDRNRFTYKVNGGNQNGQLNILAGFEDISSTDYSAGGNIYFTHKDLQLAPGSKHDTKIAIPFTNWYMCGVGGDHGSQAYYEKAGIIGGVGRCAITTPQPDPDNTLCTDTGLIYHGFDGELLVDAGTRGNIIINNGSYLSFQSGNGNARFLSRWGDIDMRYPFNADSMRGGLLFLASSELPNKRDYNCGCPEWRNNVYLQDFRYTARAQGGGSVYVGADNNIKLQYGGLGNIGTDRDPFISEDKGYPCGATFHCDADTSVNRARPLILNFRDDPNGGSVMRGGFAAVASDLIDVYKDMIYTGGQGTGMQPVPGYTTLQDEPVAGSGLYIKTRGDKKNWTMTDFAVNNDPSPTMGAACFDDACANSYLHNTARVTFHSDARVYTEGQSSQITSPVLETYGPLDLNTSQNASARTRITIRTDSLICHDSLIVDGPHTAFTPWSRLYRNVPVVKLGHHRFTPPAAQPGTAGSECATCYASERDPQRRGASTPLDTIHITYRNGASIPRLHSLVADHAAISFLTDSFDHQLGNPTLDAKIFADTFKVRNHVELIRKAERQGSYTHNSHFELVSEAQMSSKDYAGIYTRHLHMEPVGPSCSTFGYSQLWLIDPTLNVITTSQFGGFGWLHNDVYVEIDGVVAPGYASLERKGNCYEQHAGILRVQDMRMDKGAKLKISIGDTPNSGAFTESYRCSNGTRYNLGEYADFLDVDSLTLRDRVFIDIVVRPEGLNLARGETRCYPILHYNSIGEENLKHLTLSKTYLSPEDHPSLDGRYYLRFEYDEECHVVSVCIQPVVGPIINRRVEIPSVAGVTSTPPAGVHFVASHTSFPFSLKFEGTPLAVRTGRIVEGEPEPQLKGHLNDDNEYEYVVRDVREDVYLEIGPDAAVASRVPTDGTEVWSYNSTLYIKVEKENTARIYSIAGHLVRQLDIKEGTTSVPLPQGVYIVALQDGIRYKAVIK
ncbi:MAG: hypothetical protein LBJ01_04785 [Tannerella sp.]|nr:hypothetical protein [Tannerella sp.]